MGKVIEIDDHRYRAVWVDEDGWEQSADLPGEDQAVAHIARYGGLAPRFHDLRHSYATWRVSEGVPINDVQTVMGHEQASTMLDRYTHSSPDRNRRVLDAFAAFSPPLAESPISRRWRTPTKTRIDLRRCGKWSF